MDFMERRKINIMCVQEKKWKGSKARELENGFKLFYIGADGRRNGVGIILNDEMKKGVRRVGGDFIGHCGRNNSGKEETIGKYGVGESNEAGDKCVAFAMSHNMRVVNTYIEKAERHKITY